MADEKKVNFSANDSGLSAFMEKIRNQSKRLFDEQLANAKKVSADNKEQIKFLQEYIKQLQVRNKLENESRKQSIDAAKKFGGEKERDWAAGEKEKLTDDVRSQKITNEYLKQLLDEVKKDHEKTPKGRQSILEEVLKAGIIRDITRAVGRIPNASNGTEIITPGAGLLGGAAGALLGLPFGASAAGAQLGKGFAEFWGNAMTRHLVEASRYEGTKGRLRGIGANADDLNMSSLGLDLNQAGALKESFTKAIGFDPVEDLKHMVREMKAFTLDEGLISNYYSGRRYGGDLPSVNRMAKTGTNRGISDTDIDRLVGNQTQLTKLIAQSQVTPNSYGIFKSMMDFNSINGGESPFAVKDERSMGFLSTINQNLTNPDTPFAQAMSYSTLRRIKGNEGLGIVDLIIQQQRGMENKDYVKGTLDDITTMTGNEDVQTFMLAKRLGLGNNLGAARMLLRDKDKIGSMTDADFESYSGRQMKTMAEQNVPTLEKNQAQITNAFVDGMIEGVKTVSETFKNEMDAAIKEGAKEFLKQFTGSSADINAANRGKDVDSNGGNTAPTNSNGHYIWQNGVMIFVSTAKTPSKRQP